MHGLTLRASSAWPLALVLAGWLAASRAAAAPPGVPPRRTLQEVSVMLSSNEENEVRTALEAAAQLPAREVVPLLEDRVHAGLPRGLLDVSIDTLFLLGDRTSAPLLIDLSAHRRPEVRVRALEVLGRLKYAPAERTLGRALGDLVPEVRKAAAEALGELGQHASAPVLMRAFERDVEGSARALGRVASSDDVPRLLEFVERVSLSRLTPMFEALFARREVSEAAKLRCVDKLSSLDTEEARAELSALVAQLPRDASPRLRRALAEAAQPSSGAAGAQKGASQ